MSRSECHFHAGRSTGGGEQKLENSLGEQRKEAADIGYWKIANQKET
jgi:hypothetical protein